MLLIASFLPSTGWLSLALNGRRNLGALGRLPVLYFCFLCSSSRPLFASWTLGSFFAERELFCLVSANHIRVFNLTLYHSVSSFSLSDVGYTLGCLFCTRVVTIFRVSQCASPETGMHFLLTELFRDRGCMLVVASWLHCHSPVSNVRYSNNCDTYALTSGSGSSCSFVSVGTLRVLYHF